MDWWRQFEADLAAVDRAIEREQRAAIAAGQPWPPRRTAQAETTPPEAAAVITRPQRDGYLPEPNSDPQARAFEPVAANAGAPAPQHEPSDQPGRLDALQARRSRQRHHRP